MDYVHSVLTPIHLLQMGSSALNDALHKFIAANARVPRSNAEFDISRETGVFPSRPLERLPATFDFWENALERAPDVLSLGEDESEESIANRPGGELWRQRIRKGPLIPTHTIEDDRRMLQRAHLVLAFLMNFYVHSTPPDTLGGPMVIPKTIAVPLVRVSRLLGMAPILTWSDTVIWNATTINPDLPMTNDNMRFQQTFTGSEDEEEFYRANALVDLHGAELLQIIEVFHSLPNINDSVSVLKISSDLQRTVTIIEEFTTILQDIRTRCDPHYFYQHVRPWLRGADSDGPYSKRWVFEGIEGSDKFDLSGPSGGQSTIMHALDVWLDIDHRLSQKRRLAPSEENKRADHGFFDRMRRYMLSHHREYLQNLESSPRTLRDLARQSPIVRQSYNAAVKALKKFRDVHIRIVGLYVIQMSRRAQSSCPIMAAIAREQERLALNEQVRGTGGSDLTVLLNSTRDATRRALFQ